MKEILVDEWVRKAEEDYESAIDLAQRRKKPVPNTVCFLCQQCVEKYLKAFLTLYDIPFAKTHDLIALKTLCLPVSDDFELIHDFLVGLDPYSVAFRYPGEEATPEEAQEAVKAMQQVRKFIRARLKLEEE
ncbi:MAG: HEPN domain-containing protein [Anaerolineae bacterium]|jgi:HEPN domain-containing protein|nr:HEPN domain-containing protein [Anaerolineae bacterium]MDH7473452.1 HEPN domain-containing protein [Anaerolineae bacterium]